MQAAEDGWPLVERALADAASERHLVVHRFATLEDDSTYVDLHFGSNQRTLTFITVVIPTLIEQLRPVSVTVAVPWDEETAPATLTLIRVLPESPEVETRRLVPGAPFWRLEETGVTAEELAAAAQTLRLG